MKNVNLESRLGFSEKMNFSTIAAMHRNDEGHHAMGGRDTETPRHRDTETPRHRDTETPRYRDTEIPRYRDTETLTVIAFRLLFYFYFFHSQYTANNVF
jgi:hypothetical protein